MPCSRVNAIERPEVVDAFALEALELVGEVLDAVGQAVGQARLAEAAVAAARPEGDVSASSTTTRRAGSVSVRAIAVHRPVNPAPMIATSTSRRSSGASGGSATPSGAGSRSQ